MTLKNKKVLITCGPTWVPIDDVRVISNKSTGELGQQIARDLKKERADVTVLEGPVLNPLKPDSLRIFKFQYFDELLELLKKQLLKDCDILIHAAAVADYQLSAPFRGKINSESKHLALNLISTPKIIDSIKTLNPKVYLVGFKLESHIDEDSAKEQAKKLIDQAVCDLVVVNSSKADKYRAYLVDTAGRVIGHANSRTEISKILMRTLQEINRN